MFESMMQAAKMTFSGAGLSYRTSVVFGLLTLCFFTATHAICFPQDPCQCQEVCPQEVSYTNSTMGYVSHRTSTFQLAVGKPLNITIMADIQFCCRVRYPQNSQQWVSSNVQMSYETSIRCIRLPKSQLLSYSRAGLPPSDDGVRTAIIKAALVAIMSANPCQQRLAPSGQPFEWVFSIPKCLDWTKNLAPSGNWCLTPCSISHTYCVFAYAMLSTNGIPRPIERVIANWTPLLQSTEFPRGATCRDDGCYEDISDCPLWDLSKRNWPFK